MIQCPPPPPTKTNKKKKKKTKHQSWLGNLKNSVSGPELSWPSCFLIQNYAPFSTSTFYPLSSMPQPCVGTGMRCSCSIVLKMNMRLWWKQNIDWRISIENQRKHWGKRRKWWKSAFCLFPAMFSTVYSISPLLRPCLVLFNLGLLGRVFRSLGFTHHDFNQTLTLNRLAWI